MLAGEYSQEFNVFSNFLDISDKQFDDLISRINNKPIAKSIGDFAASFDDSSPDEKVLVDSLYYLILLDKVGTLTNFGVKDFVDFLEDKIFDEGERLSEKQIEKLAAKKDKILSIKNLKAIAGAYAVSHANGKEVVGVRIVTSIRPVFYDSVKPYKICGSVISNQIDLSYKEDKKLKDIVFSIDASRLEELKSIIDRAIEKNEVLNQNLSSSDNLKVIK